MLFFKRPDVKKLEAKGDIEGLIKALKYTKDMHIRGDAALALARICDARVVEPLIVALEDEEGHVRKKAAMGLGQTGDARAVEPLIAALKDEEGDVREKAAMGLGQTGDARAIEPLIAKLVDRAAWVRKATIEALKQIGGAVDSLITKLEDPNELVRSSAAIALAELGWRPRDNSRAAATFWATRTDILIDKKDSHALVEIGSPVVEPLIAALNNRNNDDWTRCTARKTAVKALGQIGDARAVEAIIVKLGDEDKYVRYTAVQALGQIGDARAVEALILKLGDEDEHVRMAAGKALKQLGWYHELGWQLEKCTYGEKVAYWTAKEELDKCVEMGTSAVEPLVAELDNPNYSVREFATKVLGQIGDPRAVEPLIVKLGNEDKSVREAAARALGQIGDALAVEPLILKLGDEDEHVRKAADKALKQLGWILEKSTDGEKVAYCVAKEELDKCVEMGKSAVKPLVAELDNPNYSVRQFATKVLGQIGDPRALKPLIVKLGDENKSVRDSAARALGQIGDALAVEPLIVKLGDKDKSIREAAARALGQIGDTRAIDPLIAELEDKDRMVRIVVARALAELGWTPPDKSTAAANFWATMEKWDELAEIGTPAVELFITRLEDEDKYVRSEAARALGQIGDTRAVDSLIAKLNGESESIYAVEALAKIGDARAVGPLIGQLKGEVCETAAEALAQIGERIRDEEGLNEQMEQLRCKLIDNDYYVRQRARKAVKSFVERGYYPSLKRAFQASEKLQEAGDKQGRELTPVTLCQDALELEPGFSAASVYLSYLYREYHKKYRKALKWSREAIGIDPQNEDAWTEQGNVYIELGDAIAATRAFAKAVTLNRQPGRKVQPYLRLIVVYDVLGMVEDKAKVFSPVLDAGLGLDPDEERRWEKMLLKAPQRALRKAAKIEW